MNAPRHRRTSPRPRFLLRAGLLVGAAGAVVGATGSAAFATDPGTASENVEGATRGLSAAANESTSALQGATSHGLGPVFDLQLDPLAGTGTDPLDNGVGTRVADFPAFGTQDLTGPLSDGASLGDLPVTGQLAEGLAR